MLISDKTERPDNSDFTECVSTCDTDRAVVYTMPSQPSPKCLRTDSGHTDRTLSDREVAAATPTAAATPIRNIVGSGTGESLYTNLQKSVRTALGSQNGYSLTTSDKVALALEVLRARQLELDLAKARTNIEALVTNRGSAPRTLRSVVAASAVKGLPVGTPIEITTGKFLISPTANDPNALFLTLELQHFGETVDGVKNTTQAHVVDSGGKGQTVNENDTTPQSRSRSEYEATAPSDQAMKRAKVVGGYSDGVSKE